MSAEAPTADYIAEILALPPFPDNFLVISQARIRWDALHDMHRASVTSPIFQDFAGKYSLQVFKAWQKVDASHATLYSDVLRACTRNCYWARFQLSHPSGRTVLLEYATRLSKAIPRPRDDQANFSQSVMLLWQFIVWELDVGWQPASIPANIRNPIIRMIKEFIRDCPGAMGTSIGEDCMLLLENFDEGAIMRAKMQKQSWEKDLLRCYCGSDGSGRNPNTLMRCSKCKIVAYCGQEHQKADWSKHKRRCFKPSWE